MCSSSATHLACVLAGLLDKLWDVVTEILADESRRILGRIDLDQMSILHAMVKREKFNQSIVDDINERTRHHLGKL